MAGEHGRAAPSGSFSRFIPDRRPDNTRVVYLSSAAVCGAATREEEAKAADPSTERAIAEGPWSSPILRPAAIYGSGRDVQESIQRGEHSLSERFVGRIHMDGSCGPRGGSPACEFSGAYPVADEEPCVARNCGILRAAAEPAGNGRRPSGMLGAIRKQPPRGRSRDSKGGSASR